MLHAADYWPRSGQPVLLLDIDGVINVFQCAEARELRVAPDLPAIRLLPGVQEWLARLNQIFWLVWCSEPEALAVMDRLPWRPGSRPALLPGSGQAGSNDWKLRAVRRTYDTWEGPLAWVEDGFPADARQWAATRLRQARRTWLVDVSEDGLTAEMTTALLEWAQT